MYLFYKRVKDKKIHIFLISFLIFICLNITENIIHYNIGRHKDSDFTEISFPSKRDLIKIIIIMFIFAILQGWFTYLYE